MCVTLICIFQRLISVFLFLKYFLSVFLVCGREYYLAFTKAVSLGFDMNHPQSLARGLSLIYHEMFGLHHIILSSSPPFKPVVVCLSRETKPLNCWTPRASKPLNPVAPNMAFKLLFLTLHLHPRSNHTPPGTDRLFVRTISRFYEGKKSIQKVWSLV